MPDSKHNSEEEQLSDQFNDLDLNVTDIFGEDVELDEFTVDISAEQEVAEKHPELTEHDAKTRYSITEKINSGGMKDIWLAEDSHTDRPIAVAIPKETKLYSEERLSAFINEGRMTANLQHPNIIPVYDLALDEQGVPYFTMKSLNGESLEMIVKKLQSDNQDYSQRYNRMALLSIFQKVCDAIAYAHAQNVLHLDLKPDNIIVCDYGEVQVIDWGISKTIDTDGVVEQIAGSPGYMAPEQFSDKPTLDKRTDIYALGALLFFILSGKAPVDGKSLEEIKERTLKGDLTSLVNESSFAIKAVTQKALSTNPDERYQSVEALQKDLNSFLEGYATMAESATFMTHLKLLVKRHKIPVTIISFSALVLFIVLMSATYMINNQKILAEAAESDALIAKEEAEKHLNKVNKLTKQVAPISLSDAKAHFKYNEFEQFEKSMEVALAFDDSIALGWELKLQQLVVEQRFNDAAKLLKEKQGMIKSAPGYNFIYELMKAETINGKLSNHSDILKMVDEINNLGIPGLDRYFFHKFNETITNPTEHFSLLKALIKKYNEGANVNLNWEKGESGWIIKLINNSTIKHVTPLCGIKMEALYMSKNKIKDLDFISRPGLKEISCHTMPLINIYGKAYLNDCESIKIINTSFSDSGFLYSLPSLKLLDLRDNPISSFPYLDRQSGTLEIYFNASHKERFGERYKELKGYNFHFEETE